MEGWEGMDLRHAGYAGYSPVAGNETDRAALLGTIVGRVALAGRGPRD